MNSAKDRRKRHSDACYEEERGEKRKRDEEDVQTNGRMDGFLKASSQCNGSKNHSADDIIFNTSMQIEKLFFIK